MLNLYDFYIKLDIVKECWDVVFYIMYDNKKILKVEYEKVKVILIDEGLVLLKVSDDNWKVVDNYVKEVINEVKVKIGKNVYIDGLDIYINLDMNV